MMDPELLINGISREILATLKAMAKAKTPEERLMYSETVKNLSDSFGSILGILSDMAVFGDEDSSLPF
ncbi:MAG TPA: hypothetical protein ENJ21_06135 [Chromatiaceae bacterium]|nr:hypothetical protein [Chromatiaceae bacterium]